MKHRLMVMLCSLCCLLALLPAAPLCADTPHPAMVLQVGHSGGINTLAYSADGKTVATGSDDGTVRLWDAGSGQLKGVISAITSVQALALASNGHALAAGERDIGSTAVQLWDLQSGLPTLTLYAPSHFTLYPDFAFSPDGRTLATNGYLESDGWHAPVQLWDAPGGASKGAFEEPDLLPQLLAFAPDGSTLAIANLWDDAVEVLDLATGKPTATLGGSGGCPTAMAFSPDGKWLASVSDGGTARLWETRAWQLHAVLNNASAPIAFSPESATVATSDGSDHAVQLWDVKSGAGKAMLRGHKDAVNALAFSPDGALLATASNDASAGLWDANSGQLRAMLQGHAAAVTTLAFAPDGKTLATGSPDQSVRFWDVPSGQPRAGLRAHKDNSAGTLALSPSGRTLATGHADGAARLWDVASGELRSVLSGQGDRVRALMFSPDGQTLATLDDTSTLRLWDAGSGRLRAALSTSQLFAFSPDGTALATDGPGNTARLWDTAKGELRATLQGHTQAVVELAFTPDGSTLATGSYDNTARLWDVASGQLKSALPGYSASSLFGAGLGFSPDGKTLATMERYTVLLWDVANGQLKATLKDAISWVFSPDSRALATRSFTATRLWDAESGSLRATLDGAGGPQFFSRDSQTLVTGTCDCPGQWPVQLWDTQSGSVKATLEDARAPLALSRDGTLLATRRGSGKLRLWNLASGKPLALTSRAPLDQFPVEVSHPLAWADDPAAVSLLDPIDAQVLATLQPLPDAPPYLAAPLPSTPDAAVVPSTGGEWITTTPDGYFEGSANLAQFIRWNVDGVLYPAAAYWDLYYRPDLVRQALKIPGQ